MEPSNPEQQGSYQGYSLSVEDFKKHPQNLAPYIFPQKVTRENFIDWYSQSFKVSAGFIEAEVLWMSYVGIRTGFDAYKSLLAFEDAGGMEGISPSEREKFETDFNRVKTHSINDINSEEDYQEAFDHLRSALKNPPDDIIENWKDLSPEDFLQQLRKAVKANRESARKNGY